MKEIGGYFGLELNQGKAYHKKAIELNTARNAFEYILKTKDCSKVYLPYYTCEVMLEPLNKLKVSYEFYQIDKNFYPIFNKEINEKEAFVYTNYWGINQHIVKILKNRFGNNLILDNSQAFYAKPLKNIDSFYSARKFFGVADGAYLYCQKKLNEEIMQDESYARMNHLLKRIDLSAQKGYSDFKTNDDSLINQPIKLMSKLTKAILESIDYDKVAEIRRNNFVFIHEKLKDLNELKFELDNESVPMVYPFLIKREGLKQKLIDKQIFVATYWPMVKEKAPRNSFEMYLYEYLLPLPIDQRYISNDIITIVNYLLEILNQKG